MEARRRGLLVTCTHWGPRLPVSMHGLGRECIKVASSTRPGKTKALRTTRGRAGLVHRLPTSGEPRGEKTELQRQHHLGLAAEWGTLPRASCPGQPCCHRTWTRLTVCRRCALLPDTSSS